MIIVTGATGKLGRLVVGELLKRSRGRDCGRGTKSPKGRRPRRSRRSGASSRLTKPDTLRRAFTGAEKLLLISSSEVGQRIPQHLAVVAAAKSAGVGFVAYTSVLRADSSTLALAAEHKATEEAFEHPA